MSTSIPVPPRAPPVQDPVTLPSELVNKGPDRLGISFELRLPFTTAVAFLAGMGLGSSHGSRNAAMRYRAENAHRFPTTPTGWFLYHKSKNYNSIIGGVKEGVKMGGRISLWAGGFFALEEMIDRARGGQRDFLSTVVAGLTVSGVYSVKGRQDVFTAARTAKSALLASLAFGLVQDAIFLAKGHQLFYVDLVMRKIRRQSDSDIRE